MMSNTFRYSPEVSRALSVGEAVVALESTVITHGLPYPENQETALLMEAAVRSGGAIPATIALIAGQAIIGLSHEEIDYLAVQEQGRVRKCSLRDLSPVVAGGLDGSTTVAATMLLAHRAGIEVFATGGIGGVHRGHPFDVSADLTALGNIPITVVCSGAKAILDLAATREVLETQGVTVVGYEVDELPAFYSRSSGLPVDVRADSPEAVAMIMAARQQLEMKAAILVGVPAPESDAMTTDAIEPTIQQATEEAEAKGIIGPASTPWLLARVAELSGGESQRANVALLKNNGYVAARIAVAFALNK